MLIENIVHDLNERDLGDMERDYVPVEWYEAGKKVLHKASRGGLEIGIRNNAGRILRDGDILWHDARRALIVEILPCECIAIKPATRREMAKACYEIGNRHAPLFWEDGELLTPFEGPLFNVLEKHGFAVYIKTAKLKTPLGGNAHGHSHKHSHEHSQSPGS